MQARKVVRFLSGTTCFLLFVFYVLGRKRIIMYVPYFSSREEGYFFLFFQYPWNDFVASSTNAAALAPNHFVLLHFGRVRTLFAVHSFGSCLWGTVINTDDTFLTLMNNA
jgi:hypothetical protein